jgi:hypothetical protein
MKVIFLGDISLNDNYIELYKKGDQPFKSLELLLGSSAFVVGNLECMIKGDKGENLLKRPRLSTTVDTLNYLKDIHLSIACLAQNHAYDHLVDGFVKTSDFLRKTNIQYLGAGFTIEEAAKEVIIERDGIKIGILNYITKDTNPDLPLGAPVYLNLFEKNKVIEDIQKLKPHVNHIVLELHWGGRFEGGLYPDFYQRKLAMFLVDYGADLIIGHHSHTFQPFEKYKGKYIFYSLGNFCFSDYLFDEKFYPNPLRRRITSIIEVFFKKESYSISFHFFRNDYTTFCKQNGYIKKVKRRNFIFKYFLRFKIIWLHYFIYKKYILPLLLFVQRVDLSIEDKLKRLWKAILKRLRK